MFSNGVFYCVLQCIFLLLYPSSGVSSLQIQITPRHIQAHPMSKIQVQCSAVPIQAISACQFRIWYVSKRKHEALFNVSASQVEQTLQIKNPYYGDNYTVNLRGGYEMFNAGACNISLDKVQEVQFMIGCKLTTESKLSVMETMSVFFHKDSPLPLLEHNVINYVRQGATVDVVVKTKHDTRLSNCKSTLVSDRSVNVVGHYHCNDGLNYYIDGKPSKTPLSDKAAAWGQCDFNISNVQERDTGVFFVLAHGVDGSVGASVVTLVLKKQPHLIMTISKKAEEYEEGDVVTVTCSARGVRQAATRWGLIWVDPSNNYDKLAKPEGYSVDGWSWPWEEAVVSQSVSLNLTREDHLKELVCWAESLDDATRSFIERKVVKMKNVRLPGRSPSLPTRIKANTTPTPTSANTSSTSETSPSSTRSQGTTKSAPNREKGEADPTPRGSDTRMLDGMVWIMASLLAMVLVVACIGLTFLKTLACVKEKREMSAVPDPVYQEIAGGAEIHEALALESLPPPSPPPRPETINIQQLAVPAEYAPARPKQLELNIPDAPDDSVNPDGYLKPITRG